jgi:hypothetical protein
MKTKLVLLLLFSILNLVTGHAQGTAFSYQGRLNNGGAVAGGSYDLAFTLFNTNASGVASAGPVTNSAVAVTNGLFTQQNIRADCSGLEAGKKLLRLGFDDHEAMD